MNSIYFYIISILLTGIVAFDICSARRNRREAAGVRYVLYSIKRPLYHLSLLLMLAAIIFDLYVYRLTRDSDLLHISYWLFTLLAQSVFQAARRGSINAAGIWYSGRMFRWEDIKAYYWDADRTTLNLIVMKSLLRQGYRAKLRLAAPKGQQEAIDRLLSEQLAAWLKLQ